MPVGPAVGPRAHRASGYTARYSFPVRSTPPITDGALPSYGKIAHRFRSAHGLLSQRLTMRNVEVSPSPLEVSNKHSRMRRITMRGLGAFQRGQMSNVDPRIHDFFNHVRKIVDIAGAIALHPRTSVTEQPRGPETEKSIPEVSAPPEAGKLAYTVTEVRKLIGISNSALYVAIGNRDLRAVKCGRRTLILAKDLHTWLENWPTAKT